MSVDFISEDDLNTWEGFLRRHQIDPRTATPDVMADFRQGRTRAGACEARTAISTGKSISGAA